MPRCVRPKSVARGRNRSGVTNLACAIDRNHVWCRPGSAVVRHVLLRPWVVPAGEFRFRSVNDIRATPAPDRVLESRLGLGRKGKRRRRWLWVGLALLAAGAGTWFYLARGPAHTYVAKPVTRGTLAVTVSATGTLAPRNQVDVGAEVSGRIDKLMVDFNDRVKKGEVLARINTDQYVAQLQQAQASLAQAQATLQQSTLDSRPLC